MRRVRRRVANKEKVFGCDLQEHLATSSQEIPHVLRICSEFIEENGVVDGIYRLSGVSSNIQKLRSEFDNEANPNLRKDVYLQDIHCVSSLCKAYFRELPNPLLTYNLYDKFAEAVAVQLEEERLVKIRDVLKELPTLHFRTLEFLMYHLVRMASHSSETNMHSRNLAIVWAPNLLRSKDIEVSGLNGTAAFMEVRVQSIVVEFILTHVSQLFGQPGVSQDRRKSLPSPTVMPGQDETVIRDHPPNIAHYGNISPGNGPLQMRPYHAIIEGTDKRKGSLKGRKWMSIFNIQRFQEPWRRSKNSHKDKDRAQLRPARSMDCLSIQPFNNEVSRHPVQLPSPASRSGAAPSPLAGAEAGTPPGAAGSSGYAVTYRRGTGVLSGGAGTPGTYSALDPEGGAGSGEGTPPANTGRSPGQSSARLGRRAAMHISGPHLVTVPLHITSNLALGVLQGGGGDRVVHCVRDREGGERVEGKARGGGQVERRYEKKGEVDEKRKEQDEGRGGEVVEGSGGAGEEDIEEGAGGGEGGGGETVVTTETSVEDKEDKQNNMEEDKENWETDIQSGGEELGESEEISEDEEVTDNDQSKPVEKVGDQGPDGEQGAEIVNSDLHHVSEDSENEYMDMKGDGVLKVYRSFEMMGDRAHRSPELPGVLDVPGLEGEDHELSGYVQDNFDFLDHIDCSASNQVNEFSVEPPGYEDDEYEEMEARGLVLSSSPRAHADAPPPAHLLHRRSEPNPGPGRSDPHHPPLQRLHHRQTKSLSLPYMSTYYRPSEYSCSSASSSGDEGEGCNADDEDDDSIGGGGGGDDDGDDNEDECMFYQSLPSGYALHNLTRAEPDGGFPSPPPAAQFVELHVDEQPGAGSEAAVVPVAVVVAGPPGNGETQKMECEHAVKNRAEEQREVEIESCEGNKAQPETLNQRVETGDLHLVVHTSPAAGGSDPLSLIPEPEKAMDCSLQTQVLTGTEATAEVRVEENDISLWCVKNSGIGPPEVTTPPSPQIETWALPGGILDVSAEFCEDLPDPPSDGWEDDGMNSVEGNGSQGTSDLVEEMGAGAPDGEPKRVQGYKSNVQMPEADICMLDPKGEDVLGEMVQRQSQPIERPDGSSEEIGMIPRDGEQPSGEGETELQVVELLDVHDLEERVRGNKEETIVQKDEAGITEKPIGSSGEVFDQQVSKDPRKNEDLAPVESDSTVESVPDDGHDRRDGKNQEEQQKMSVCGDSKIIEAFGLQTEAPEKERKDEGSTREPSQPPVSMNRKADRTNTSQGDAAESKHDVLKGRVESHLAVGSEKGVGRKLVISHQSPAKVYQVRSVPIVPPKPQHCRLTALNLRQQQEQQQQQQQQQQQSEGRVLDREREWKKETPQDYIFVGEVEAAGEGVDEKRGEVKHRKGPTVAERQRRSRDWEDITVKDASAKNNPHSMCFDEAVAKATMRRERERESGDRDRQRDWVYE